MTGPTDIDTRREPGEILLQERSADLRRFVASLAVLVGIALAPGGSWYVGPIVLVLGAYGVLLFSVLRTTVTRDSVRIAFGPLGQTIPMAAITSVGVEPHSRSWLKEAVRRWDGHRRFLSGRARYLVRIVWRDASGNEKTVFVSSEQPQRIVRAIGEGRAALGLPSAEVGPEALRAAEDDDHG